jgi:hypothetical protein
MEREEEIPIEDISIYLEFPIGFEREERKLHDKGVLESRKENIDQLGQSNLTIAQKLEGIEFMGRIWTTRISGNSISGYEG